MTQNQRKSASLARPGISLPPIDAVCQCTPTDTRLYDMPEASNSIEPNWDSELFKHLAGNGTREKTKCPIERSVKETNFDRLSRRILRLLRHVP